MELTINATPVDGDLPFNDDELTTKVVEYLDNVTIEIDGHDVTIDVIGVN